MNVFNLLLFGVFPYVALVLLLTISILRYRTQQYSVSSLSSQFLESPRLFWGSTSLHIGVLTLFLGHLIGFLIPRQVQLFAGSPLRLVIMEVTGLVAGLLFLVGLVLLVLRRIGNSRLRSVTSTMDLVVYGLLLLQALSGLYIAFFLRWGSVWYVQIAVPYVRSIFMLQPDVQMMAEVPFAIQLHVLGAFALFAVFSFSRLMHILVAPLPYVWRTTQLVIWNRDRSGRSHREA
jgi:nitrate reductase gamma subunit